MAGGLLQGGITGSQRSLIDSVTLVNAKALPFLSMVPKGPSVNNLLYEWPLDEFEDADTNAVEDGKDVENFDNAQEQYATVANRIQWLRETAKVSYLAGFQNQAGVSDGKGTARHVAYAYKKKLEKLMRDMEAALCSEQDVTVGASAVANKLRGVGGWLATSIATAGYAVDARYLPDSNQILSTATNSITDAIMNGAMGATWDRGGTDRSTPYVGLCGRLFKERVSSLTQFASGTNTYAAVKTYNADLSKKVLWHTIDSFQGDYGLLELHPSHWLAHPNVGGTTAKNQRFVYGLNMKTWDLVYLDRPTRMNLPDLGGGPRFAINAVIGLRCYDPKANFAIKSTAA
jgi:hypothetical protein